MSPQIDERANGMNGHVDHSEQDGAFQRFAHIPPAMDIPVFSAAGPGRDDKDVEVVEVDLEDLMDDSEDICTLLENENAARTYWITVALAYAKQDKFSHAIDIVTKGMAVATNQRTEDRLSFLACLCCLYLFQCRHAPRTKPDSEVSDVRTKEHYIQAATATLNEASRLSPSYPPLFLARGTLCLLRASLLPSKPATLSNRAPSERTDALQQASKCFDDALRASSGRNVLAVMGKARTLFSLGKYAESLSNYQSALEMSPTFYDPDPRIGIGCSLWQLGHKEEAFTAWQRARQVSPKSKIANLLLGLYHLDQSAKYQTSDAEFQSHYKKAMTQFTQTAWKLDGKYPLTCATFGNYFLLRKAWPTVERLARQAIEATDVTAIASDGWFLLGRKEHYENNIVQATEYYNKADQARGGDDAGYLPAKFGLSQLKAAAQDFAGAKFRLEKIIQQTKRAEAMTLLGVLHAESYFNNKALASKDESAADLKKAIGLLEQVRTSWKTSKRAPDSSVLLNLARLYEVSHPERSLQCLDQVEKMELDEITDDDLSDDVGTEPAARLSAKRELLAPQLLNNLASFNFRAERYPRARELFQTALNACVKGGDRDGTTDTDALVTTISFNLARTYEAENMLDEARQVYEGLLARHPSYVDARIRLALITLQQEPKERGPAAIKALLDSEPSNLDVRALYGWYIHRSKRKVANLNEDPEQRHFKHSLQQFDKHDRYSLVGMGNLHLSSAREMRRETDEEKGKRTKMYQRAIEFFDKALQLDPQNAYAAQGVGIVLVEERKDYGQAIQIFTKVRETIKDASVFTNLGHVYCEVKQYARAIENYEAALSKSGGDDTGILTFLGRAWFQRGKLEKSLRAMTTALEYAQSACAAHPSDFVLRYNVALLQFQVVTQVNALTETTRTLAELESASVGLDEAIASFEDLAATPNGPVQKNVLDQRVSMARGSMRSQLDRNIQSQRDYETKNAARLEEARKRREADIASREAERKAREDAAEEQRRKLREEREKMMEEDRQIALRKAEEQRAREEADMSTDPETGERRKRERKKASKRKKKTAASDDEEEALSDEEGTRSRRRRSSASDIDSSAGEDGQGPKKSKRRKLERKSGGRRTSRRVRDDDIIVDSDEEAGSGFDEAAEKRSAEDGDRSPVPVPGSEPGDDGAEVASRRAKNKARVLEDDEDEEVEDAGAATEELTNGGDGDAGLTEASGDVQMHDPDDE